jgi:predicted DNA-binding transcriptional regulator YafY
MSFEEHAARIERLIGMIEKSDTRTAEELARKLGVSRRTFFNDLEFLRIKGYQIGFSLSDSNYYFKENRKYFRFY